MRGIMAIAGVMLTRRAAVGEDKRSLVSRLRLRLGPFVILLPLLLLVVLVLAAILYVRPEASQPGERTKFPLPGFVRRWQERRVQARLKEIEQLTAKGDAGAVKRLIRLLRDGDERVRQAAGLVLGDIGDPRAVEPLIAALKDGDWHVRLVAAKALGEIKDPRAVGPLIAALKDSYVDVRWAAARSLGELKDPCAAEPLRAALKDSGEYVREAAVVSLGKIEDPRAVEPLITALKDANGWVRRAAADALRSITGADCGDDPEKWRKWWEQQKQGSGVGPQNSDK